MDVAVFGSFMGGIPRRLSCGGKLFAVHHPAEGCLEEDEDVQPEAPVFDVPDVVLDTLLDAGVAAQAVHLGPAGDAGAHLLADEVEGDLLLEVAHMVGDLGAGADQAHVTFEDIEKLGKFIHAELADEAAEAGFARVGVGAPAGLLGAGDPHAAELEHLKRLAILADPFLLKKNGAGAGELDADGGDEHDGAGEDDEDERAHNIHPPLAEGPAEVVQWGGAQVDELGAAHRVDGGVAGDVVAVKGDEADADALFFHRRDDRLDLRRLVRLKGDDHLVEGLLLQKLLQLAVAAETAAGVLLEKGIGNRDGGTFFARFGFQISVRCDPEVWLGGEVGQVLGRHGAAADQQHMLLVIAKLAVMPQQAADDRPLADDRRAGEQPEQEHRQARELHDAGDVQKGHEAQHRHGVDQQDGGDLAARLLEAVGAVHPQRGVHQHHQQAVAGDDQKVPRGEELQGGVPVEQLDPDIQGQVEGAEGEDGVRDDVEEIDDALVLFDQPCSRLLLSCGQPVLLPVTPPSRWSAALRTGWLRRTSRECRWAGSLIYNIIFNMLCCKGSQSHTPQVYSIRFFMSTNYTVSFASGGLYQPGGWARIACSKNAF